MPLGPGVRYRVKQTSKGPVRLAFKGKGKVVEAKNLKTGATHSAENKGSNRRKGVQTKANRAAQRKAGHTSMY